MDQYTEQLFYFYPERFGFIPSSIDEVYIAGDFNEWGKNIKHLEEYKLTRDRADRWVGVIKVSKGKGYYKFFLNKNTYCPDMSLMSYSTVSTPEWAKKAVWYQIMVDRFYRGNENNQVPNLISWNSPPDYFNNFGGDLKGIQEKIPYFKNLFGNLENKAFYLNPIHTSLASNHKYWPEDFETIDPQFGTEEDLKNLINALHKEGARIILDLVYNHTGLNHYAFQDILKNGKNSKYFNWYRKLPHLPGEKIEIPILENHLGDKPANIDLINDPRSKKFDPSKESFICVWGGKYKFPINEPEKFKNSTVDEILNGQPNYKLVHIYNEPNYKCWERFFEIPELNTKSPEVKQHLFEATGKWIKMGIDGFRLDVPDVLADPHQFWQEFRQQMRKKAALYGRNPDDIYIVGELWSGRILGATYLYGDNEAKPVRFDAIMNYPIRENIFNFFSGEILNTATDSINGPGEITVSEMDKNLHKNFEYISWGTAQVQYNVFSSHDTRRLRSVIPDLKQLKTVMMMEFSMPGAPAIYYGDELGMFGGKDPANRATMRWDIYNDLLHHKDESSVFNLYKKLINFRDNNSCLIDAPYMTVMVNNDEKIYAYARYKSESECVLVIVARNGIKNDINIDISGMPFENIVEWKDLVTDKAFVNYGKSIVIQLQDMQESFGIILTANNKD